MSGDIFREVPPHWDGFADRQVWTLPTHSDYCATVFHLTTSVTVLAAGMGSRRAMWWSGNFRRDGVRQRISSRKAELWIWNWIINRLIVTRKLVEKSPISYRRDRWRTTYIVILTSPAPLMISTSMLDLRCSYNARRRAGMVGDRTWFMSAAFAAQPRRRALSWPRPHI